MEYSREVLSGLDSIVVTETDAAGGENIHCIPVAAIASWSVLLGYTDPADAFDAILAQSGKPENPGLDGRGPWEAAYERLAEREAEQTLGVITEGVAMAVTAARSGARSILGAPTPGSSGSCVAHGDGLDTLRDDLRADIGGHLKASRDAFTEGLRLSSLPA